MRERGRNLNKITSVAIALIGVLMGCTASVELTRPQAKILLAKHTAFISPETTMEFAKGGYEEYLAQGGPYNPEFVRVVTMADNVKLTLKTPYTKAVDEITGIVDAPFGQGMKEVQFAWSGQGIPEAPTATTKIAPQIHTICFSIGTV
jgi:hypothetical protein